MQSSRCLQQAASTCRAASACTLNTWRNTPVLQACAGLPADRHAASAARLQSSSAAAATGASVAAAAGLHAYRLAHSQVSRCCQCYSTSSDRPQAARDSSSQPSSSSSSDPGSAAGSESSIISYNPSSISGWVINKQPVNASMTPELYGYMLKLTKEHEVLAALREETAGIHGGHMQVAPEQGQFMAVLVKLLGVKSAIEVGVFTGYSSLAVALALPPDGRLVAFDRDAKTMATAQKYWLLAGVSDKVDARLGPGLEGLQQLLQESGPDFFDFAFIDADKGGYQAYFDLCLQLVRPGGCIAVDNVLFYGRVVDPARDDKATVAIRNFNEALAADARVDCSIVPIGDGVALCRKR